MIEQMPLDHPGTGAAMPQIAHRCSSSFDILNSCERMTALESACLFVVVIAKFWLLYCLQSTRSNVFTLDYEWKLKREKYDSGERSTT